MTEPSSITITNSIRPYIAKVKFGVSLQQETSLSTVNPYRSPAEIAAVAQRPWGPRRIGSTVMCGLSLLWAVPTSALAALIVYRITQRVTELGANSLRPDQVQLGMFLLATLAVSSSAFLAAHRYGDERSGNGNGFLALSFGIAILSATLLAFLQ